MLLALHNVEIMISTFPPDHMTVDRLSSYNDELREIRDKFREFSGMVLVFAMNFVNTADPPKSSGGQDMNVNWWQKFGKTISSQNERSSASNQESC